jgi:hypothetical protein
MLEPKFSHFIGGGGEERGCVNDRAGLYLKILTYIITY